MEEAKHINWLGKYLAGEISAQEKAELMSWVSAHPDNKKFFDEAVHVWGISDEYVDKPFVTNTSLAWQKIETRLSDTSASGGSSSATVRRLSMPAWWMRAAAVILLLISVGYGWRQWQNNTNQAIAFVTQEEEKEAVTLPDGSKVWLNERSSLTFDQRGGKRLVTLEGEAFFEVKRDEKHPFVITSGQAVTTVLGTSFNVRAYPKEAAVQVTVASGKVQFNKRGKEQQALILTPGKAGVLQKENDTEPVMATGDTRAAIWKEAQLRFENQTLEEVLPILEAYFNVQFELANEAILKCHIQGVYDQPKLSVMLQVMHHAMGIEAEKKNDHTVVLSGAGC